MALLAGWLGASPGAGRGVALAADGPAAVLPAGPGTPAVGAPAPTTSADRWQASVGLRTALLRDPGFDPFSTGDGFAQVSFAGMHALGAGPGLVPAVGLALDLGSADASARGASATLGLLRLAVVLEPRFVLRPGLYLAARLMPGLLRATATLHDASAPAALAANYWTLSIDASVGAGVRLNGWGAPVGLWLLADGGYGWAPSHELTLAPSLPPGDANKAGAISLGALAPRGPFLRAAFALTY